MKVFPLYEGSYSVDSSKKFIPFSADDDASTRKGSLFVHIYPFLVETNNELILLDAGLGTCNSSGEPMIHENIRQYGYHYSDVSKIIMSHLHKDHSLGLLRKEEGQFVLNFPDAQHFIQSDEMQAATNLDNSSYCVEEMIFLEKNAKIQLLNGNGKIGTEIKYELSGGHCPAHQVIKIDSGMDFYFFGGDVLPETSLLIHNYIAKYDFDGRLARDLRIRYGKDAAEQGWTCLFYHDNNSRPVSQVGLNNDQTFRITSLE